MRIVLWSGGDGPQEMPLVLEETENKQAEQLCLAQGEWTMTTKRVGLSGICFLAFCLAFGGSSLATNIRLTEKRLPPPDDYNMRLGALYLSVPLDLGLGYDFNIDRAEDDADVEEGWVFTPGVGVDILWPASPHLQIDSGINFAYQYYPGGEGEDQLKISGTQGKLNANLDAELSLGTNRVTRIIFSEEFSRDVDTIDVAAQNVPSDYALNTNTLSVAARTDLNALMWGEVKVSHEDSWAEQSQFEYQDLRRETVDLGVFWRINRFVQVGPYAQWQTTVYKEDLHNDSDKTEIGVAFTWDAADTVTVNGNVGWEDLKFDEDNAPASEEEDGFTGAVALDHAITALINHGLSLSYTRQHGTLAGTTNYSEELQAGYDIRWRINQKWAADAGTEYLNIEESDAGEQADLYQLYLGCGYRLSEKTSIQCRYTYTEKASDDANNEYDRNFVNVNFRWRF